MDITFLILFWLSGAIVGYGIKGVLASRQACSTLREIKDALSVRHEWRIDEAHKQAANEADTCTDEAGKPPHPFKKGNHIDLRAWKEGMPLDVGRFLSVYISSHHHTNQ